MNVTIYHHRKLPVKGYGGTERFIVWLIKGLNEFGHRVALIGPAGSNVRGCVNIAAPFECVNLPGPREMRRAMPRNTDILHINHDGPMDYNYGVPTVVSVRGCLRDAPGLGRKHCFISDAQRKYWGYPSNRFIHNGLDQAEYLYREEKEDYLLFLSRVDWDVKGLDWAINVSKISGSRLIIAGNVHRKNFVNSYLRGYLKKRLSDKVLYVGPVEGEVKAALLAKASGLLFPTQWCEPFGIVVIEALASGTPVITTRKGAMPEIIEHGRNGFLCSSVDEMAKMVGRLGDINPSDCLRSIEERFNYRRMSNEYVGLYECILGQEE